MLSIKFQQLLLQQQQLLLTSITAATTTATVLLLGVRTPSAPTATPHKKFRQPKQAYLGFGVEGAGTGNRVSAGCFTSQQS